MDSDTDTATGRGRPKGDKRARTRAALIEAARKLVREKGYEHTTMEDVAREAGMTTGAIYGNFRNRDELFIALADAYWPPITPTFKPGSDFSDIMDAFAEATIAAIPDRRAAAVGFLTGRAYALGHEDLRARARHITAQSYEAGAEWLAGVADRDELPMPPEILVRVIHALTEGLLLQRFLTPDLVPDEVFRAAFKALATTPRPDRPR